MVNSATKQSSTALQTWIASLTLAMTSQTALAARSRPSFATTTPDQKLSRSREEKARGAERRKTHPTKRLHVVGLNLCSDHRAIALRILRLHHCHGMRVAPHPGAFADEAQVYFAPANPCWLRFFFAIKPPLILAGYPLLGDGGLTAIIPPLTQSPGTSLPLVLGLTF